MGSIANKESGLTPMSTRIKKLLIFETGLKSNTAGIPILWMKLYLDENSNEIQSQSPNHIRNEKKRQL